jgi:RNA polymerase sigma-70 factor (ECF subfamily)
MATVGVDERELLNRCLAKQVGAWNDFVDQYLGLIYRVIHFTAYHRSVRLTPEDVEDLAADVLLQIVANDYAVLRQFQGRSTFATYLTVIARRICVHALMRRQTRPATAPLQESLAEDKRPGGARDASSESLDQIHHLLGKLPPRVREVVRLFYLEGRSYEEISAQLDIPVNSIGPVLARAKAYLRKRMHRAAKAKAPASGAKATKAS